jgi:hypothetical protein
MLEKRKPRKRKRPEERVLEEPPRCPHCLRPLPEEEAAYALTPDTVYCPTCGWEQEERGAA